jgi:pSer/pThr/pTyr-binding forkhead associated (FHA) protein
MGSRNGTFVNELRVTTHTLDNGDAIVIGDCQLRFLYSNEDLPQEHALRMMTLPGTPINIDAMAPQVRAADQPMFG